MMDLYRRGFLYAVNPTGIRVPDSFISMRVGKGIFYYHCDVEVALATDPSVTLLVFGHAVDVRCQSSTLDAVAQHLHAAVKAGEFYDALDFIAGRFGIIISLPKNTQIVHDAAGLRSIFYTYDFAMWASHSGLLRDNGYGRNPSEFEVFRMRSLAEHGSYKSGYPGFSTPYEGILVLPPNHKADLSSKKIIRYFPREPNTTGGDVDSILDVAQGYLRNQVVSLLNRGTKNILCSLTAGLDSRVTLAITRSFPEVQYFTYRYTDNSVHDIDVQIARIIAKRLKIPHTTMDINDTHYDFTSTEFADFNKLTRRNTTFSPHGIKLAYAYKKTFADYSYFIRSNLYEIARAYYLDKIERGIEKNIVSEHDHLHLISFCFNRRIFDRPEILSSFESYTTELINNSHGYDVFDLFYWEHRMGLWHSQVVTESDPAFDTAIIFNSRAAIKLFLSFDINIRRSGWAFRRLIERNLPELTEVPINTLMS